MDSETKIYVVWGPTAEWGDGSGPLFYSDSLKDCGQFVRDEKKQTVDYASQIDLGFAETPARSLRVEYEEASRIVGWPNNMVSFWVECERLGSLLDLNDWQGSDEELLEYLNER